VSCTRVFLTSHRILLSYHLHSYVCACKARIALNEQLHLAGLPLSGTQKRRIGERTRATYQTSLECNSSRGMGTVCSWHVAQGRLVTYTLRCASCFLLSSWNSTGCSRSFQLACSLPYSRACRSKVGHNLPVVVNLEFHQCLIDYLCLLGRTGEWFRCQWEQN